MSGRPSNLRLEFKMNFSELSRLETGPQKSSRTNLENREFSGTRVSNKF